MANVQGFDFVGSAELKAQADAAVQRMRESGDLNTQLAANSQQVIGALFGSPEIRKAQATEAALSQALGSVEQREGESDIDFGIRQNAAVRDKMAQVDPDVAIQANDKIIRLQSEKLEQRALKNRVDTGELELKNALATAVDAKTPYIFKRTPSGDTVAVGKLDPKATPEEIEAELNRFNAREDGNAYVVGSGLDRLQLESTKLNRTGGINKSGIQDIQASLHETAVLMRNGVGFMDQMLEAPLSLTKGAEQFAEAGSFLQGVRRVAGNFYVGEGGTTEDPRSDDEIVSDVFSRTGFSEQVEDLGVESGISRGLVLNMAYSLAKTLDPGGRLSDQDVEMAIQMLVGTGDPNQLKVLLRERFEEASFKAEQHKTRVMSGGLEGQIGVDNYNSFVEQRDMLFERLDEFEELIDEGGLLQRHRSAFGKTRQQQGGSGTQSDTSDEAAKRLAEKRAALRARLGGG